MFEVQNLTQPHIRGCSAETLDRIQPSSAIEFEHIADGRIQYAFVSPTPETTNALTKLQAFLARGGAEITPNFEINEQGKAELTWLNSDPNKSAAAKRLGAVIGVTYARKLKDDPTLKEGDPYHGFDETQTAAIVQALPFPSKLFTPVTDKPEVKQVRGWSDKTLDKIHPKEPLTLSYIEEGRTQYMEVPLTQSAQRAVAKLKGFLGNDGAEITPNFEVNGDGKAGLTWLNSEVSKTTAATRLGALIGVTYAQKAPGDPTLAPGEPLHGYDEVQTKAIVQALRNPDIALTQ